MQVKVVIPGEPLGGGIRITAGDKPLEGVRSITIRAAVDEIITAEIDLLGVAFEGHATALFSVVHPITGKLETVSSIVFADGSVWPPA